MYLWLLIDRGWKCFYFEIVWRLWWSWYVVFGMKMIWWVYCVILFFFGCWYVGLEDIFCIFVLYVKDGLFWYIYVVMIWVDINKYVLIGMIGGLIRDLWRVWIIINFFMYKFCIYILYFFYVLYGLFLYIEC